MAERTMQLQRGGAARDTLRDPSEASLAFGL
jgi:hypothetical protein